MKTLVSSLFSWTLFYNFPKRANVAFVERFPAELQTVNAKKTRSSSIVFLLHENATDSLFSRTFFDSFSERAIAAFSKRIPR